MNILTISIARILITFKVHLFRVRYAQYSYKSDYLIFMSSAC
jgi:hypothetical protein